MSDTIDRLVRMIDERDDQLRQAKDDIRGANSIVLQEINKTKAAERKHAQAARDLEIAERVIAEWEEFEKKHRGHKGLSKMPRKYYRSDIPF